MRTRVKTSQPPKARENASDQIVTGFSLHLIGLRKWCEFSGPITKRRKAKVIQSRIIFETSLNLLY